MAAQPERTRRKMVFGRYMQALRERCEPKLTPEVLSNEIRVARTTIHRMEAGLTVPGYLLVRTLTEIYNASDAERTKAEQLWEAAKASTTRIEHVADMPAKYRAFRRDEMEASRERTLDTVIIPGLLQTADYAAAIRQGADRLNRSSGGASVASIERHSRQELLTRQDRPLELHALVDEVALHRMVGGLRVMTAQLDHLLAVGRWPNVTIQIVPFRLGAYGPMSGPFILLDYDDPDLPSAAYLEYVAGGETVENTDDVAALSDVWDRVAAAAPSVRRSTEIIRAARDLITTDEPPTDVAQE